MSRKSCCNLPGVSLHIIQYVCSQKPCFHPEEDYQYHLQDASIMFMIELVLCGKSNLGPALFALISIYMKRFWLTNIVRAGSKR